MRKTMERYKINFNFFAPYRIIVDGNFLKKAADITLDIHNQLGHIFKEKIVLCTTKCIQNELKLFGRNFDHLLDKTNDMKRCYCEHQMSQEPSTCILKHIGVRNRLNYIVATQDDTLIESQNAIPRVPILHINSSSILNLLEESETTLNLIAKKESKKLQLTNSEAKNISDVKKEEKKTNFKILVNKIKKYKDAKGIKLTKKPAKGPNPLSMRKGSKKINKEKIQKALAKLKSKSE